jgi:DNA-binding beta-propeller fold protein YncE
MGRSRAILAAVASAAVLAAICVPGQAGAASHVYVTAWCDQLVDEYTAGPYGGLTKFGSVNAGDSQPWYMAMTSNAKNLYLTTYSGHDLEAFSVGPKGGLTHKDVAHGGETPAGTAPVDVAVSPDNRNAYAVNYNSGSGGSVWIYNLGTDGSVKPHSPDPSVTVGSGPTGPYGVAVSRDGKSVYVATSTDDQIYEYNRGPGGSLTPKTTPSIAVKGSNPGPDYLVLTPDGKHLYSANYNTSNVGVFNVGPGGVLAEQAASPVAGGYGFYEMAMSPNGKNLYAASNTEGKVYLYSVAANGALTPTATKQAGTYLDGVWLSPNGKNAYVANIATYVPTTQCYQTYNVAQFTVGPLGGLTAKAKPTVATDDYPAAVIVAPDQGPTGSFTFSHKRGLTKKFNARASHDPDGKVTRYEWHFGDGLGKLNGGPTPKHKYAKAGKYKVQLIVFDDAGCSRFLVWTGHTAYCKGNLRAAITHTVDVKKPLRKKNKKP